MTRRVGFSWHVPSRVFRLLRILQLIAALALLFSPSVADSQTYQRIAATIDGAPSTDATLYAARDELLAIAIRADRNALNRRVEKSFFWDRDHGGAFNRRRSATENLAAATNWKSLRTMLSSEIATPRRDGSADHCMPARARPRDEKLLDRVAEQLKTDTFFDWGVVTTERQSVRASGDGSAAEVGALSRELVRVTEWAFDEPEGRQRWVQVVMPTGAKGYVDGRHIQTLAPERLCLRKDAKGLWRISGYIGGGD
jgi:hypothetical protein